MDKAVYTVLEVAQILGVSRNCVYDMVKAGKIAPVIKIGKGSQEIRIPRSTLELLLQKGVD